MADDLPTPAEFIRRELENRGLTQQDLAFALCVPAAAVSQIASGRRGISAEMACSLGAAFGMPAKDILGLQKAAELQAELAKAKGPSPAVAKNAKIISTYPVRKMVKRGWIDGDRKTFDQQLATFFDVDSVDEVPHLAHAGKKSGYSDVPPEQLAWMFRVKHIARETVVPPFSKKALRGALPKLKAMTVEPEEARHVPRLLSECGIRFVIVESLPGGKIDGVCFWLKNNTAPVIGMSLRFDRIDNFWFVLRHELEHVLRGDGKKSAIIDADLDAAGDHLPPEEIAANEASLDFCVPKAEMDSWIARKTPYFSERDLVGFARRLGVHPGLVAGQLRMRTGNFKLFSRYLAKVRFAVVQSAIVDGWGQIAPVTGTGIDR